MKCPECGRIIEQAKCGEGWCVDCSWYAGSRYSGMGEFEPPVCRSHRVEVSPDDHCKDWSLGEG